MALTHEEQERLSYIQGDLAKAELLTALVDAEDAASGMANEMADAEEDSDESSYQEGWNDGYAVGREEGARCSDVLRAERDHARAKLDRAVQLMANKLSCEPVAWFIGIKGSAYDLPTTKRAYTYAEQPGNAAAWKLGQALETAKRCSAGDSIDAGLVLLKALQAEGFGVFQLGDEYAHPPRKQEASSRG